MYIFGALWWLGVLKQLVILYYYSILSYPFMFSDYEQIGICFLGLTTLFSLIPGSHSLFLTVETLPTW